MVKKKQHKLGRKLLRNLRKLKSSDTPKQSLCYFGFTNTDEPKCMVAMVEEKHLAEIQKHNKSDFKINDWFVSIGQCEDIQINGPFNNVEEAFDFCKEKMNISRFEYQPQF